MDVISHAGSVFGGIVVAEYAQLCPLAHYDFLDVGEEVVGVHERLVAQQVACMRAAGVEVPQGNDFPVFMHFGERIEQHFNTGFALSVRTGWAMRVALAAVVLIAVDSCGRGEDEVGALWVFLHGFEKIDGADYVVFVIEHRLLIAFSNSFLGCEVHHAVDRPPLLFVLPENGLQKGLIHDAALVELHPPLHLQLTERVGQNSPYPFEHIRVAVGQIVNDDHVDRGLLQNVNDRVRADEAQSSRDEQILNLSHRVL